MFRSIHHKLNLAAFWALCTFNQNLKASDFSDVGLPLITHFNQEQYQAHHANWDIHQSASGLIYIANGSGILEYDGERFIAYDSPNNTGVRDLEVVDEKVYIGTLNDIGFYQPNHKGVLEYISLASKINPEHIPFGEIYSVKAFDDHVVFKAMSAFFIWNGTSLTTVPDHTQSYVKTIAVNEQLYTKLLGDDYVYQLTLDSDVPLQKTSWQLPKDSQIKAIVPSRNNDLVFFTAHHGIYQQNGNDLTPVSGVLDKGAFIYDAIMSKDGFFYVATINSGLFILSEDLTPVKNYQDFHGLNISQVTAVMQDQQNNIWTVGYNGLNVMRPPNHISNLSKTNNMYAFEFEAIQGKPTFLGKRILQLATNAANPLYPPSFESVGDIEGVQRSLDVKDKTFLCTNNGLYLVSISNNEITEKQLVFDETKYVFDVAATDDFSHTFITTNIGVYHLRQTNNQWTSVLIDGLDFELNKIEVEDNKHVWIGSRTGDLYRLNIDGINTTKQTLKHFGEADGLDTNLVIPFKLSTGLVFGTMNGLFEFNEPDNSLKAVTDLPPILQTNELAVELLYEDLENNLWYTAENHQGRAYKQANQWQLNEQIFQYLPPRFNANYVSVEKGILWIMQTGGEIFRMDVNKTASIPNMGKLHIRELKNINTNETIQSGTLHKINNKIDYESNSIRVRYALSDHITPQGALYRTRLNGSQNPTWSSWTNETYRDFTELRGNQYLLEVQAKDAFGRISDSSTLKFSVLPPYYLNRTALVAYAILGTFGMVLFTWLVLKIRTRKLQQENLRLDDMVKAKTQHLNSKAMDLELVQQAKDRFFTNFSHELRTPLSLIKAPLEQVKEQHPSHLLDVALKNTENLQQQINRIFDLQHLNDPVIKLQKSMVNVNQLIKQVANQFIPWAEKHRQNLQFLADDAQPNTLADGEKVQAVISNLISNAIKHAGVSATITIRVKAANKSILIDVIDDGPGVNSNMQDQLFDRFQTDDVHNISHQKGVGIGLAYAQEIMQSHEGDLLLLESLQGAHFQCLLPIIKQAPELNHINKLESLSLEQADHPVLMLVEDNNELREVLFKILTEFYVVYEFSNADSALFALPELMPDAIISDVMMPGMNGVDFTHEVRKFDQYIATPIILLTAKSAQQDINEGLQAGATDYIVKPFSPQELLLRVHNHIEAIHAIRNQLTDNQDIIESEFIQSLNTSIIQLIQVSRLNTQQLAEVMAMDRSTLFRKIKKETDRSPTEYLMHFRLELAKKALLKTGARISDVAYQSGFDSVSYFSTTFKKHLQLTPSEFIKQKGCNQI